jgi:hypothetical protein
VTVENQGSSKEGTVASWALMKIPAGNRIKGGFVQGIMLQQRFGDEYGTKGMRDGVQEQKTRLDSQLGQEEEETMYLHNWKTTKVSYSGVVEMILP